MTVTPLDAEQIKARYDETSRLLRVTYFGDLAENTPALFYQWLDHVDATIGIKNVRGVILDMRKMTKFHESNLSSTVKESRTMNREVDMSHLPVVFWVQNPYQEEIARILIKLTPQKNRRVLRHTEAEALAFIEDWHKAKA